MFSENHESIGCLQRLQRDIDCHCPIGSGERVLVAWSGGSDSTALVVLLRELARQRPFHLGLAHFDHGQLEGSLTLARRLGEEARRWKVPFFSSSASPETLPPGSNEGRCRQARLDFLSALVSREGYHYVATGHTRDDQVETLLLRMVRGTGVDGLGGIAWRRSNFVRPLLGFSRAELQAELRERGVTWTDDPANQLARFPRNRIRHEVLPLLRQINPRVDQALLRLAAAAQRDSAALWRWAETAACDVPRPGEVILSGLVGAGLPDAVVQRALVSGLGVLMGPGSNQEKKHFDRILSKLGSCPGQPWRDSLGDRVQVAVHQENLCLHRDLSDDFCFQVEGVGSFSIPKGNGQLTISRETDPAAECTTPLEVRFDASRLTFPFTLRSWSRGDRLRVWGGGGTHKVGRLLMDAKIPRHQRSRIPIVLQREVILWVAGLRRSDLAPVGPVTQEQLVLRWYPPEDLRAYFSHPFAQPRG